MMKVHRKTSAAPRAHARLRRAIVAATAALLCTLRVSASAPPEQAPTMMIPPPDRTMMRYGEVVATCGELAVIGAPVDGDLGAGAGAAEVVRLSVRANGSWDCGHVRRLRSLGEGDHFGCAAAIAHDGGLPARPAVIAVGADRAWVRSGFEGAVFVFGDADATPRTRLTAPLPQPGAEFGNTIALDATATTMAVGARREDVEGLFDCGAVHIFARGALPSTGSALHAPREEEWHCIQSIVPPSPAVSLWFGSAVALSDRWLAVGVPGARINGSLGAGCVCVYERDATGLFIPTHTLSAPVPSSHAWFGTALAMDGSTLLIGEPRAMQSGVRSGAAWIFDLAAQELLPVRLAPQLRPNAAVASIGFGASVAIDARVIVIGAPGIDDGDGTQDRGGGFVFQRDAVHHAPSRLLQSHERTPMLLCGSAAGIVRVESAGGEPSARAALLGHLFVEEESVVPSPGVALYDIDKVRRSARSIQVAQDRRDTTSQASASNR